MTSLELDTMPARFARLKERRKAGEISGPEHWRAKVELERRERELLGHLSENADRFPYDMDAKRNAGPMRGSEKEES
ncbi:MAG: hypothetical protein AAGA81_11920 [Acidobacteriota bacterium]